MPPKNPVAKRFEFFDLCVKASQTHKGLRINRNAIRHLRKTMITTVKTKEHLPEALTVVFTSLAEAKDREESQAKKRYVTRADIDAWLSPPAAEDQDEVEWESSGSLEEQQLHAVRKVLDRKREKGKEYFLVDWNATWEPRANLPLTLIAQFHKVRRALVRKTYIEDDAVEA